MAIINGNGLATPTGRQLLQIIPINIITILCVVASAVGLYYKFDARITAVEKTANSAELTTRVTELTQRVGGMEGKMNENTQRIIRIETNVLWLVDEKKGQR